MSKTTKTGIVAKVLAILNLTDEGRVENFFMKQRSLLEKDIKNLKKNLDTLTDDQVDAYEELQEKLDDARGTVEEAYASITIDNVKDKATANAFADVYWDRVTAAESVVKRLEKQIEAVGERFVKDEEEILNQIAERERRLANIN